MRAGARARRAHRARHHGRAAAERGGRRWDGARGGGEGDDMKRIVAIAGFLALAVLIGAAYPLVARGPELAGAEWQYPWYLLALLLVPWLFWRGTYGEDARRPRLLLGTVQGFSRGPVGRRVWLRDLPGVLRTVGFVLLVLALGRPLNAVVPQSSEEEGIDLVLVLDLSGSMQAVI